MTGRDVDCGRGSCRGRFRGSSPVPRGVIDAIVEPTQHIVDAVADVTSELHGSWSVATRAPAVDGREWDREQFAELLWAQQIVFAERFTCVFHHS